jgi:hypothetical protein
MNELVIVLLKKQDHNRQECDIELSIHTMYQPQPPRSTLIPHLHTAYEMLGSSF